MKHTESTRMSNLRYLTDIMAALWPERRKALVSVSAYRIGSQAAGTLPLPPQAEFQWWYHFILQSIVAAKDTRNTGTTFPSSHHSCEANPN